MYYNGPSQSLIENAPGGSASNSRKPSSQPSQSDLLSSCVHSKFLMMCLNMLSCSQSPSSVSMMLNNGLLGLCQTVARVLGVFK